MATLSPRERVAIALAHQEPDKVPIDLGEGRATSLYVNPYAKTAKILGLGQLEIITSRRNVIDKFDERFLKALDIDFRRVCLQYQPRYQAFKPGVMGRDEWGIGWQETGPFWTPVDAPLKNATIDDLQHYPWPDPINEGHLKGLREEAEFKWKNTRYSLVACLPSHAYGIFTTSYFLRGMENFFVDLMINKEFAWELMEKVLQVHLKVYERYLEEVGEFIAIVHTGDDLGTQEAPFFSLDLYREMLKPKEKVLMDLVKNKTEAKIFYHCDGAIFDFIEDLIEIGVDILNPVQHTAKGMDLSLLKASFGDRLSFQGGIDQQRILTGGTTDEVKEEVKRCIDQLGPGGGYILNAIHNILPEVTGENVVQMYRAARQYGDYPISGK